MATHYEADDLLEKGVMAELSGKPNARLFKRALQRFEEAERLMHVLDSKLEELIAIDSHGKLDPTFTAALKSVLAEHRPLDRATPSGVRFANVAQDKGPRSGSAPFGTTLAEVMKAQQADLAVVRKQLRDTIEAFRGVIPAAEKGEFAALMLSGRAGFADKIQQAVDLIETFAQFYTRSCMTTITATMHAYPAGLRWLKDARPATEMK